MNSVLCPFCDDNIKSRTYIAKKYAFAFVARHSIFSGQSLVSPKRHVTNISDLTADELLDIALCCQESISALEKTFGIFDFNIILNNGILAGQTVPHLHYHIIPRIINDLQDPKSWLNSELYKRLHENSNDQIDLIYNQILKHTKLSTETYTIEDNVSIGNSREINRPQDKLPHTVNIGKGSIIRSGSIIYNKVQLGENFDCGHNVLIRENTTIGNNTYIYPSTQIHCNVIIGSNCRISGWIGNNCIIENNVSCFGQLIHKYTSKSGGHKEPAPIIREGAMIGWNAIIMGGVTIGEYATVGAGSIVTKNVASYETVYGKH